MTHIVSREVRTLVTLHEGTDTTARDEATDEIAGALESLAESETTGGIDWNGLDAEVYEHPAAPFDPYTIVISFRLFVSVDAESARAAEEVGARRIETIVENAGFESVSYPSPAIVSEE
ncbi:hypothetical protein [Halostagnicola bangensis]